ncbi:AI-2E family transporter [Ramlibacter sp.]|uniref:AI-2E family transporter n=1 Tax=Ramlibacter sp. TaxID=1917967 RepID=UPI002C1A7FC0|nr:AI-2E family transporter [Ramlibacter sp.]HWI81589.1 AI-2E family transporter [Ramlibacter sp.]
MEEAGKQIEPVAAPVPADPQDPSHALLHVPVNVRSMSLVVLAVLASLATLRWASGFFIPLMIGFLLSYALSPVVDWLERVRIPRALSAAVLILGIIAGSGGAVYSFSDDVNQLVSSLPAAARKLRDAMHLQGRRGDSTLGTVQEAAAQLEQAAKEAGSTPAPARGVQRVVIEKPTFDVRAHLWSGTVGLASLIGQVTVVTFLTYFLLLSGDTFRRKLVKISGDTLSDKKITVQALDEINSQIQRYLLVQVGASVFVGAVTGLAFWALGLKHAAVWGFGAGVLNMVPYIGSAIITGAAALVAFLQFGAVDQALAVAAASLAIHAVVGNLLVPWLTSRTASMNPVVVFIGVLAWGWLWGVWGLLLGIPILMVVKAVCDRVDHLKPIGELLGS